MYEYCSNHLQVEEALKLVCNSIEFTHQLESKLISMDQVTTIKKDSPIHVKAKVITYDNGKKLGLQPLSIRKSIWNNGKVL